MKRKVLHMDIHANFILYLGFVSTLGGAIWCFLCHGRLKELYPLSYPVVAEDGIAQLALSAALHILLAAVVWLDRREKAKTERS